MLQFSVTNKEQRAVKLAGILIIKSSIDCRKLSMLKKYRPHSSEYPWFEETTNTEIHLWTTQVTTVNKTNGIVIS